MKDLTIVYMKDMSRFTPHFRHDPPYDASLLLQAYEKLPLEGLMPSEVGFISVHPLEKKNAQDLLSVIESPTTTYTPLALIEAMESAKAGDDILSLQSAYRRLSYLIISGWIHLDPEDIGILPDAITEVFTLDRYRESIASYISQNP